MPKNLHDQPGLARAKDFSGVRLTNEQKSLFTNDLGFIPRDPRDWDLCTLGLIPNGYLSSVKSDPHDVETPCSIGQNRLSYLRPQKRCRHVFPG